MARHGWSSIGMGWRTAMRAGMAACFALVAGCTAPLPTPPGFYLGMTNTPHIELGTFGRVAFVEASLDAHGCLQPAAGPWGLAGALSHALRDQVSPAVILVLPDVVARPGTCLTPAQFIGTRNIDTLVAVSEQVTRAAPGLQTRFGAKIEPTLTVVLRAAVARQSGELAWRGAVSSYASPQEDLDPATLAVPYGQDPALIRVNALNLLAQRLGRPLDQKAASGPA